jgi:AhpD family alkylhydroperoxidase
MPFDNRTTELIAIGASMAANCQSCVEYHVGKAVEFGVDPLEIAQAVEVGRMVRQGAAARVDKVADALVQQKEPASPGTGPAARWGCGCGWAPEGIWSRRGGDVCGDH